MELHLEGILTMQKTTKVEFFASIVEESSAERSLFYDSKIGLPGN
jgi:hypothetical protein